MIPGNRLTHSIQLRRYGANSCGSMTMLLRDERGNRERTFLLTWERFF